MQDRSRALVATGFSSAARLPAGAARVSSAFAAQLLAVSLDAPAFRQRRREAPALATAIYRRSSSHGPLAPIADGRA